MANPKIQELLHGFDRYNPEHLTVLEDNVTHQCKADEYDFEANILTLTLYQLHATKLKVDVVANILLKSLMAMPSADFSACLFLVGEEYLNDNQISRIIYYSNLLEMCHFKTFWEELTEERELVEHLKGFAAAIRNYIAATLHMSHQRITRACLEDALFLADEELTAFVDARAGWTQDPNDPLLVVFDKNQWNQVRSTTLGEKLEYESLQRILINNA